MPDIVLSPASIEDLIRQVEGIKQIAEARNAGGWPLFMYDETWKYETTGNNTCDVCYELEYIFNSGEGNGPRIPELFPQWTREGTYRIRPRVHQNPDYPHLYKRCNCTITMLHPMETLKERLNREIEERIV